MNGIELLRIVDAIHRDKNIDKAIVFDGIEQAIASAARKHFGEECEVEVDINQESGQVAVQVDQKDLDPDQIGDLLGRIAGQTAKQVMIQRFREAERDSLYDEFETQRGQIVTGSVTRVDGGSATVNLGKVEALLPRGEQIPGESHRVGERVRAIVMDVRKAGSRVKIILSRTHPEFVRRLFELEIPEVAEHVIEVRSLAREAGYRSKVAVSCYDSKIDCVGACVGVRGSRIKSIVDELAGERIDIVRWNDSLQVLVPNSLQPAEVEDVILCPMLGKVIVLVRDDQLSLAIGKKGQNVRLGSKLVGWDIHVMTQEKLDDQLDQSVTAFSAVPGVDDELAENLVAQGFFTFDDLSVIEPDQLAELGGLSTEQVDAIIEYADRESLRLEKEERLAARQAQLHPELAQPATPKPETDAEEPATESESAAESEAATESETAAESEPAVAEDSEQDAATGESAADKAPEESAPPEESASEEPVSEDVTATESTPSGEAAPAEDAEEPTTPPDDQSANQPAASSDVEPPADAAAPVAVGSNGDRSAEIPDENSSAEDDNSKGTTQETGEDGSSEQSEQPAQQEQQDPPSGEPETGDPGKTAPSVAQFGTSSPDNSLSRAEASTAED